MRPRAVATHAPEIALPTDAAHLPGPAVAHDRLRLLAFAVLSLAVHAGLFVAFWRDPVPLASIGEQVISLEIVIGATAPAGVAQAPGENEVQAAAAPEPQQPEPPREPEQLATVQPQTVPVAPEEKAPEQTARSETPVEKLVTETPKREEEKPPEVTRETEVALAPPPEEKPAAAQPPKPVAERRARQGAPPHRGADQGASDQAGESVGAFDRGEQRRRRALRCRQQLCRPRVGASAAPSAVSLRGAQPRRSGNRHGELQPRRRRARHLIEPRARLGHFQHRSGSAGDGAPFLAVPGAAVRPRCQLHRPGEFPVALTSCSYTSYSRVKSSAPMPFSIALARISAVSAV